MITHKYNKLSRYFYNYLPSTIWLVTPWAMYMTSPNSFRHRIVIEYNNWNLEIARKNYRIGTLSKSLKTLYYYRHYCFWFKNHEEEDRES